MGETPYRHRRVVIRGRRCVKLNYIRISYVRCGRSAPYTFLPYSSSRGLPIPHLRLLPSACHSPLSSPLPPPPTMADMQRTLQSSRWSTLVSHAWNREAHINGLELEALQLGLRWHASQPLSLGARLPVLLDSSVAYYITRKGRTNATSLLSICRRTSALTLALSASLVPMWLPSHLNPADAPSRSLHALASGSHLLAAAP